MRRLLLLALLLASLAGWRLPAAAAASAPVSGDLRFQHLSVEQGLSQSTVSAIVQDQLGYLWIGTDDGLNRYDGYQFTVFQRDPSNPQSIANNRVNALLETSTGELWVGTYNGLERFDPQTETFTHYTHRDGDPASLVSGTVGSLVEAHQGAVWVGTNQGLDRYDPASGRFTHFLPGEFISCLFQEPGGTLWAGTRDSLVALDSAGQELERYPSDGSRPGGLQGGRIMGLAGSPAGELHVATLNGGVFRLPAPGGPFERLSLPEELGSPRQVRAVRFDREGRLWVGTSQGLFIFEPGARQAARRAAHSADNPHSLVNNQVLSLYADRSGTVWIGTMGGGLDGYSPSANRFPRYSHHPDDPTSLSGDVVMGLLEDRRGNVWVGTVDGGLNRLDPTTGQFTRFPPGQGDGDLRGGMIQSIAEDPDGSLWIGTADAGLAHYDPVTGRFRHYTHDPADPGSLAGNRVIALLATPDGTLWAGTEAGLERFDRSSETFTHFPADPADPDALHDNLIIGLYADRQGRLWVSTGAGLEVFDPHRGVSLHSQFDFITQQFAIPGLLFPSVYQDGQGVFWVASSGQGLLRLDLQNQTVTTYTRQAGLPNDTVYCIQPDEQGGLWLSTNKGLSRFDPASATFRNYDIRDGLQNNEFNAAACARGRDGRLYFGGITGINAFLPSQVQDEALPPPVLITSVRKGSQAGPVRPLDKRPVELSYRDRSFTVDFVGIDFTAPDRVQYAYRLEGFDPDWVLAGSARSASYTNLPGGDYTFRVKAANRDGVWNETGAALRLHVTPPLWQTWWFRGGAGLALLGLAAGGYGLRVRGMRLRQAQLEALVAARTEELSRQVEQRQRVEAELRLSQALYTEIFDNTPQQIFLVEALPDGRFRIVTTNPAHRENSGLAPEQIHGKTLEEVLPAPVAAQVAERYRACLSAGQPMLYEERGPSPFWDPTNIRVYRTALAPVRDGDGQITRLVGISTDITEQKQAEMALAQRAQDEVIAAERNRLARELHDAVTQTLFSASLIAEVLPRIWERSPEQGRQRLAELRELNRGALAEMRSLLWELRPAALVEAELGELLRHLVEAFIGRTRIPAELSLPPDGAVPALPPEVKLAFYRIAQEALNNAAKHSGASQVALSLRCEAGELSLEIVDDGCGFTPAAVSSEHLGLGIMRERAEAAGAALEICSRPGGGACVRLVYRLGLALE